MAVLRALRRRLRLVNPCTTCLVVVFLAVVFYLVSAISGIYLQSSVALKVDEGPRIGDRRPLSALAGDDGGSARQ